MKKKILHRMDGLAGWMNIHSRFLAAAGFPRHQRQFGAGRACPLCRWHSVTPNARFWPKPAAQFSAAWVGIEPRSMRFQYIGPGERFSGVDRIRASLPITGFVIRGRSDWQRQAGSAWTTAVKSW